MMFFVANCRQGRGGGEAPAAATWVCDKEERDRADLLEHTEEFCLQSKERRFKKNYFLLCSLFIVQNFNSPCETTAATYQPNEPRQYQTARLYILKKQISNCAKKEWDTIMIN